MNHLKILCIQDFVKTPCKFFCLLSNISVKRILVRKHISTNVFVKIVKQKHPKSAVTTKLSKFAEMNTFFSALGRNLG